MPQGHAVVSKTYDISLAEANCNGRLMALLISITEVVSNPICSAISIKYSLYRPYQLPQHLLGPEFTIPTDDHLLHLVLLLIADTETMNEQDYC